MIKHLKLSIKIKNKSNNNKNNKNKNKLLVTKLVLKLSNLEIYCNLISQAVNLLEEKAIGLLLI